MNDPTMLSCEEALRLLTIFLDGELHSGEQEGVERHLEICRGCYSRAEFERRLKTEVGHLRRDEVRPAFEQRIRQLLLAFTSSPADRPADDVPGGD